MCSKVLLLIKILHFVQDDSESSGSQWKFRMTMKSSGVLYPHMDVHFVQSGFELPDSHFSEVEYAGCEGGIRASV